MRRLHAWIDKLYRLNPRENPSLLPQALQRRAFREAHRLFLHRLMHCLGGIALTQSGDFDIGNLQATFLNGKKSKAEVDVGACYRYICINIYIYGKLQC